MPDTYEFQSKNLKLNENSLKGEFFVTKQILRKYDLKNGKTATSQEYLINDSVVFQAMLLIMSPEESHYFVKFTNKHTEDKHIYTIKYTHKLINTKWINKCLTTDDGTWRLIDEFVYHHGLIPSTPLTFTIEISDQPSPSVANPCASLHDDTELTDVELRGSDGSIHIHKAIAAASSSVIRRMFSGAWRETAEGVVDVPDTTTATLQHWKDYMYLGTIPETGLEQLLLLASFYMIPELELKCVKKLITNTTPENAYELILFAAAHNMSRLLLGILERVENKTLEVHKIRKGLLVDE